MIIVEHVRGERSFQIVTVRIFGGLFLGFLLLFFLTCLALFVGAGGSKRVIETLGIFFCSLVLVTGTIGLLSCYSQ